MNKVVVSLDKFQARDRNINPMIDIQKDYIEMLEKIIELRMDFDKKIMLSIKESGKIHHE